MTNLHAQVGISACHMDMNQNLGEYTETVCKHWIILVLPHVGQD